jgi:hypothetical protein
MNYVLEAEGDPEGAPKLEGDAARLMGSLLTIFGLAASVTGLWFHARGLG